MSRDDDLVATTESGPVRGRVRSQESGARSIAFLGVPFAAAPVGELSFAAPQPAEAWTQVRDALHPGATPLRRRVDGTRIPEPAVPGDQTLNVNVFTPDVAGSAPVLVWIHGGGFVSGSPSSPWYDGRAFNRDGVVTVSVSYRLGCEGFGAVGSEAGPGPQVSNLGVLDQLAALQWVRRNIAAFGGDPRRVTIAGQSAGATGVLGLLSMPEAQSLFARAIAISPTLVDISLDVARERTRRVAEEGGVAPTVEGLRGLGPDRLLAAQDAIERGAKGLKVLRGALAGRIWGPVVDGEVVERGALAALRDGVGATKPLLIGAARDEVGTLADRLPEWTNRLPVSWLMRAVVKDSAARQGYLRANRRLVPEGGSILLAKFVTDAVFRRVVPAVADARIASEGAGTWVYGFGWRSPRNGWAHHCLDVPFWFDCLDDPAVTALAGQRPRQELADAMHGAAVSFIRGEDPAWPRWSEEARETRVFGANEIVEDHEGYYDGAMPLVAGLDESD
ncbi:carboxylesterase/lipase family protein [Acidipropionibacterium virtanenii]|uniref:Carboxylic ester hydrolase n=1 Tax=Acidipropionibacterium virtanenii TaxID=2057246 RepID=A0A344UQH8_9ACTN|nr:carboxylesterase family protein [Acidipropionibacterium virtanenii]AXE37526.1 Carboxylesterase [Acidipropionibacterium virtanenii]